MGAGSQNTLNSTTAREDDLLVYRRIREYLAEYPRANAMQIANATGVSISKITRYVREGGLVLR
ncbi:hypothetical protein PP175_06435 [Aneurinibacillus sp. Ricciae_BoGa-3]|uniref:hypothetical protein n=1 Tax=Aneurinibacillus sp. Ricciae_BoGa-3 TaxID=3022697 RepID=UPI00234233A2|nr:hypothetical protein [Aneurinibacillus sp. Ricciae_BoGa-3]WCK55578.1 hypothetical protein PP175_06435 [Aneurinibacillus sp. Ricciae_BoGa-3]